MTNELLLRDIEPEDLLIFFEQQLDQAANCMAAFTAKDPTNQEAYIARWHRNLADKTDPQPLLREAASRLRLRRFEIVEPSLHDIFVETVKGHEKEAA